MSYHSTNRHIAATGFFVAGGVMLWVAWHVWPVSPDETAAAIFLAVLALVAGLQYSAPEGG